MTIALDHEWASLWPFGADDQETAFTPERVAIEKLDGQVVSERLNPRESFDGHEFATPWDPLQRAYCNGYAPWTYLTTPFLLTLDGMSVREIAPGERNGQTWVGLQAHFPPEIASHSSAQEFCFADDRLLRRHDYRVDVAGGVLRHPVCRRHRRSRRHHDALEAPRLPRRCPRQTRFPIS
jgi:hypothetical protein